MFETPDVLSFFSGGDWQYPDPVPSYFIPKDSSAKVGLARVLANLFLDETGGAILWINETGIWQSAEHMDLLFRYRLSWGEGRTVAKAPIHVFETRSDLDSFISILSLCLFFVWGFEIMKLDRSFAVTVSHDEWLEYRFAPGQKNRTEVIEKQLGFMMVK